MILINNNWEIVNNLYDISRIVRNYYNRELADKIDTLIMEVNDELKYKDDVIYDLREALGEYTE